jgi:glycosyltransferase involved in cell wall biosynthesis
VAVDPDPKTTWSDKSTMNKIMDYMFFARPIVAFDLRENRFSAEDAAVYVTPNSEGEMATAIESLLADENRRRLMGEYGKARVPTLLWKNSVPHLLSAYEHLFQATTEPQHVAKKTVTAGYSKDSRGKARGNCDRVGDR